MANLNPKCLDLTGQTFGRWTVLSEAPSRGTGRFIIRLWFCRCICGTERAVRQATLRNGTSTSCGCYRVEQAIKATTKHGMSPASGTTGEYNSYYTMLQRCYNSKNPGYKNYGGRGIQVCLRWRKSFIDFFADMGPQPTPAHSLDRFPNRDGNYEPANVRWATPSEQSNNRNVCRYHTRGFETLTLSQWARRFGHTPARIAWRVANGWPMDEALETPAGQPWDTRRLRGT